MANYKAAIAAGALAVLFVSPQAYAQQLAGARVVTTCGAVAPFPTPHVGSTFSLTVDATGTLCSGGGGGGGGGLSVQDEAAFTAGTSNFTPSGGQYNSTQQTLTSGQQGTVALSPVRSFYVDTQTTNNNLYAAVTAPIPPQTAPHNVLIGAVEGVGQAPTVSASASVTSLVLKASATTSGMLYAHAENITGTGGFCIIYNGTVAPATGALTAANVLLFQQLPAMGSCDFDFKQSPIIGSAGVVVLVSSATTPFTYTTGAITAAIYGKAV